MRFLGGSRKVSRQRRWQLRKKALGLCTECGKPAFEDYNTCLVHAMKYRRYQRNRTGAVRINKTQLTETMFKRLYDFKKKCLSFKSK